MPVTLAARGARGDLAFDIKGQARLKLAREATASELKDLSLSGSFALLSDRQLGSRGIEGLADGKTPSAAAPPSTPAPI